jgi:hypothetical protein
MDLDEFLAWDAPGGPRVVFPAPGVIPRIRAHGDMRIPDLTAVYRTTRFGAG